MDSFFLQFSEFALAWRWPLLVALTAVFVTQFIRTPIGERKFTALMTLYFFLLIVAYWILKPIKKALFIGHYKTHESFQDFAPAQMELLAKEANILIALIMALLLVWLRRRFPSSGFGLTVTLLFSLGLAGFIFYANTPGEHYVWALYLFGDIFVSSMVALFFSSLHDAASPGNAKRIYGFIGMGGVLGGFVGSMAAGGLDKSLGISGALGASLVLTLFIALIGWLVSSRKHAIYAVNRSDAPAMPYKHRELFVGARAIAHSRPLLLIAAILLLYEVASVVLDYQFTSAVSEHVSTENLKQYFGAVYTFSNAMAVLVQLLLTTWVIRRHSLKLALLIMPMAILLGESAYLLFPMLFTASLLNTVDGAFAYSVQQTARETLYVPLSRLEKYEAKAFIDIVWLRFSKGIAVVLSLGLTLLLPGDSGILLASGIILLTLIWLVLLAKATLHHASPHRDASLQPAPID